MTRTIWAAAITLTLIAATAAGQVPVTGVNANLQDIVGTSTLVTVVLKQRGSEDPNCQLVDVGPGYLSVLTETGQRFAYRFEDIREIRVQGNRIEEDRYDPDESRALTEEEAASLRQALSRAREVFQQATDNQSVRMDAAALLAMNNDEEAEQYLVGLAQSNDLETALEALLRLYAAGKDIGQFEQIDMGLESGNRTIKGAAMILAGLTGDPGYELALRGHAEDRMAEIAVPAVRSLARLGSRDIVPILLEMLGSLNQNRAEAAIDGLVMLGGDEVIRALNTRLENAVRLERQRILEVLYHLDDPEAELMLVRQVESVPTLARRAAIVLASDGNYFARTYLTENLNQRYDRDVRSLNCRAEMAAAVSRGGDRKSAAILQDLLRTDEPEVRDLTLRYIAELGRRTTLPVLRPALQHGDLRTAVRACEATVATLDPEFRARLLDTWYRVDMRGHCEI